MDQLTSDQLANLEGMLRERQYALREDIRRESNIQDEYSQVASEAPDPGDAAFADLSIDLGNAAIGRDIAELRRIEAALARIENGTYGECSECGYRIPYERLLVQPTAERCTACQGTYERTHAADIGRGATM
jgi:RNA polymerase-binding protein DksA